MGSKWYETFHFEMVCKCYASGWKCFKHPTSSKITNSEQVVCKWDVRSHLETIYTFNIFISEGVVARFKYVH